MKILLFLSFYTYVYALSDEFINEINSKQNLWRAGRNFPENIAVSEIRGLLGVKTLPQEIFENIPIKYNEVYDGDLPESFDARETWSQCKTIKQVADQSACGSCWAVSTASAISDRICIHSNGKLQPEISAKNLMSCNNWLSKGCHGGYTYYAWLFWQTDGIVSGGPYGSKIGCQPYPFAPCEHYVNGSEPSCLSKNYETPKCVKACDDSKLSYEEELIHGGSAYRVYYNEETIKTEIFKNGPVVAAFEVFTDFLQYKSGVYSYTSGILEGRHAIRLIGWGEENGTKYWLAANSWNEDWGDKGFFKIRRGQNDCGIEGEVMAGLPKKSLIKTLY